MPKNSPLLKKPRLVQKLRDFFNYVRKNDGKIASYNIRNPKAKNKIVAA